MAVGSFRKKASFSDESFTARFSRKEIISASLVFSALDSASLDVLSRLEGADASRRWYTCRRRRPVTIENLSW